MKTYFITGVMGFVGSHWAEKLLKNGNKVIGMDIHDSYKKLHEYKNFKFIKETIISNKKKLFSNIEKVDYVLHLASIAEPAQYMLDPKKVINIAALATIDVIDICYQLNKKVFFTSTSEIYGKNNKIPFKEDDDRVLGSTTTKRWCYSSSKAIAEHYLEACAFNTNLDFRIVRLFNVYGPRLKGRVVPTFINNALANRDLEINGSGNQTRCFTYIDDVINAFDLILLSEKCKNQIFNVGTDDEISISDFAKKIIFLTNSKSKLKVTSYEDQFGKSYEDIYRRVPDISKIYEFIKWKPTTNLEDGIKLTINSEL
jgi:UDP-glucose 4-epimerase